MKVLIEKTISMITGEVISESWSEYYGPVAECKGDGTAKDQLATNNNYVAKYTADQDAIRKQITDSMQKYLSGSGEGFDPEQLALMKSQFLNQNTANFNQAGSAVKSALASRGAGGGDLPVGGDFVRGIATLEGAKANSQSQGVLGINLTNLQQALSNRFNAASVDAGQTAQIGNNINTFSGGANNSLNQYVSASNQGFGNAFTSSLGKGLGAAVSSIATGGIGASLGAVSKYLSQPPPTSSSAGYGVI